MTLCGGGPAEAKAAQYLAGEMSDLELEEFENHFVGCGKCHAMVTTLLEVKSALASEAIAIKRSGPDSGGRLLSFPLRVSVRWVALGSIAAMLLLAVLVGFALKHRTGNATGASSVATAPNSQASPSTLPTPSSSESSPAQLAQLEALADLRMPQYRAAELRGIEAEDSPTGGAHAAFVAGMRSYTSGDCKQALTQLAKIPPQTSDAGVAALYSGLCQLQDRQLPQAEASFDGVIADGDTPQLEAAEFYRAQTALLRGDDAAADEWLRNTIALQGDYEARARRQRSLLHKLVGKHVKDAAQVEPKVGKP